MYSVRDVEAENFQKDGVEYDFVTGDGVASSTDMTYYSIHDDYGNGGNYIPVLNPGEELQVDMAWIINEPDLSKAFLNLSGEGACWEFTEGNGGNYIPVLNPGEELQVDMAWIINEPDLSKAFLNLSGEGACWEFTETVRETGLVDIRQ